MSKSVLKIATGRSKGIETSRICSGKGEDNYNKSRKIDIDEAKRQGEEYHKVEARQ